MIRAWTVSATAARDWAEGWLDDADLLLAWPLPGQPVALYVAWLRGRRHLLRVLHLCARRGWGLACVDQAGHYAAWRWDVVNGPARYAEPASVRRCVLEAARRHRGAIQGAV